MMTRLLIAQLIILLTIQGSVQPLVQHDARPPQAKLHALSHQSAGDEAAASEWRATRCEEVGRWAFQSERGDRYDVEILGAARREDWHRAAALMAIGGRIPPEATEQQARRLEKARLSLDLIPAAARGDLAELRRLLRLGADANLVVPMDDYQSPLAWAAACNQVEALKLLLASGARADQPLRWAFGGLYSNSSALHAASRMGSVETVTLLLAAGADPNQQEHIDRVASGDERSGPGDTPLMAARTLAVIRALLAAGGDPNRQDMAGRSALSVAMEREDQEAAELLLKAGARRVEARN